MSRSSAAPQLFTLPTELVTTIASLLSTPELIRTITICRRWHTLLITTPSLWQQLIVNFESHPHTPLAQLVGYSQGLILQLSLAGIDKSHCSLVLAVLSTNMHLIRYLRIWFNASHWLSASIQPPRAVRQLIRGLTWPAPMLKAFQVGCEDGRAFFDLPEDIFASHAPMLRHITIDQTFTFDNCTAFCGITSLCANPDPWSVHDVVLLAPTLQELRLCGTWKLAKRYLPHSDPAYWGCLRALSISLACLSEDGDEDPAEAISFVRNAGRNGVKRIALHVKVYHSTFLRTLMDLLVNVSTLCISRGRPDFDLEWYWPDVGVGHYVEFTDHDGRVVTLGDSFMHGEQQELCTDDDSDDEGEIPYYSVRSLLRGLDMRRCAEIGCFTLCESMFRYVDCYLAPLDLPNLETFAILIVPLRQRRSTALFDCGLGLDSEPPRDMDRLPFINAPKLFTLRLACHPQLPAWSMGRVVDEWQDERVIELPREVTASSLSEFISNRLVFDRTRLGAVVLDRVVVLSEGFRSDAADGLRRLTDDLRYERS